MSINNNFIAGLRKELDKRNDEIRDIEQQLNDRTDQLEQYTRRNTLPIFEVAESDKEDYDHLAISIPQQKAPQMFQAKRGLKNTGVTIREDLTQTRLELLQAAIARFGLQNTWIEDGTIIVRKNNSRIRLQTFTD